MLIFIEDCKFSHSKSFKNKVRQWVMNSNFRIDNANSILRFPYVRVFFGGGLTFKLINHCWKAIVSFCQLFSNLTNRNPGHFMMIVWILTFYLESLIHMASRGISSRKGIHFHSICSLVTKIKKKIISTTKFSVKAEMNKLILVGIDRLQFSPKAGVYSTFSFLSLEF